MSGEPMLEEARIPLVVNPNLSVESVVSVQEMDKPMNLGKMLIELANEAIAKALDDARFSHDEIAVMQATIGAGASVKPFNRLRTMAERTPTCAPTPEDVDLGDGGSTCSV